MKNILHKITKTYRPYKSYTNILTSSSRRMFSLKEDYQKLSNFDPEPEILKFYPKYLNKSSKEELVEEYNKKLDYIHTYFGNDKNSNSPLGYISSKYTKFMGILEYKPQLNEILKIIIEKIANSEENTLHELSEYYFKQSGKMIRPYLLILISKYLYECNNNNKQIGDYFNSVEHNKYVKPFSACVEVLHNASLLHDDIIDNSDKRRNYTTAHNIFGIKKTVFGANYIISRAANLISELDIQHLSEIYSSMAVFLTYGECQQSLKSSNYENIDNSFRIYMVKTYYKTASLIALSFRGLGLIYNYDEKIQRELFNLGLHLGMVFQIVDDVMDVLYDTSKIKKPAFKDIQEGVINSYILYEINDDKDKDKGVLEMAKRKFRSEEDVEKIKELLKSGNGIIKTQNLAMDHLIEAFKILENPFFIQNGSKTSLYQCFDYLINRKA